MASSQQGGSSNGANAPSQQQTTGNAANNSTTTARGARWQHDEEEWVLERFSEDPSSQWRHLIGPFNAHFAARPARNASAMRQHFRLWRSQLQARLDEQRNVGEELVVSEEDEGTRRRRM